MIYNQTDFFIRFNELVEPHHSVLITTFGVSMHKYASDVEVLLKKLTLCKRAKIYVGFNPYTQRETLKTVRKLKKLYKPIKFKAVPYLHSKLYIIHGIAGFIGSMNLADTYSINHMVKLSSDQITYLEDSFPS
jgi:phosphatidylserine/phosphatidylglycerophosphate/cardiolipin synthase-like enzyme